MIVNPVPSPTTVSDDIRHPNADKIDAPEDLIGDVTSWPSLSESTRPTNKSSPAPDAQIAVSQGPTISHSPEKNKHPNINTTKNPNVNWQKPSGRGGSGRGGSSRDGFMRHPPPPQQLPPPPPLPPAFYGGFEGPMRGPFFYGNNFGPHPRPTDHQFSQPRGGPRGDGAHRYNHVNYQGSPIRNQMPPQRGPPMVYPMPPQQVVPFPFMHPPIPSGPFMGIPPYTGGRAPVNPPSSLSPPHFDLQMKLLNQINYYFSDENLVKDMYLRSRMDDGGWVPVALIANFNKVRELTQDIQLILDTLGGSAVVEVQGGKIRRHNDWRRWIPSLPVLEEPTTNGLNTIIRCLQNATLEEVHAADRSSSSATNASSSSRAVLT